MNTPGLGHNNGPTMESGAGWRRVAWANARAELLPVLPIEVVRLRVKRAKELGLPYKTYASVRASTGHDVIGFLFSSNALRLGRADATARLVHLADIRADRTAIVHRPMAPAAVARLDPIDAAHPAPLFTQSWSAMRKDLLAILHERRIPADRVMLIGDTSFEQEWVAAAKLAGYLPSDRYFAGAAS